MAKNSFENELMFGMQKELQSYEKKQGVDNLVKAAEYLHAAIEILEEAGLDAKADQVLKILDKIGQQKEDDNKYMLFVWKNRIDGWLPYDDVLRTKEKAEALKSKLEEYGHEYSSHLTFKVEPVTQDKLGYWVKDDEDNSNAKDKPEFFDKVMKWLENPAAPVDLENPQPGEELSFTSIIEPEDKPVDEFQFTSLLNKPQTPSSDDLVFQSIAAELGLIDDQDARGKPNKPKNPTKIPMFNMLDSGLADDLLNAEIVEEPLEVSENDEEKTFEDSD